MKLSKIKLALFALLALVALFALASCGGNGGSGGGSETGTLSVEFTNPDVTVGNYEGGNYKNILLNGSYMGEIADLSGRDEYAPAQIALMLEEKEQFLLKVDGSAVDSIISAELHSPGGGGYISDVDDISEYLSFNASTGKFDIVKNSEFGLRLVVSADGKQATFFLDYIIAMG